MSAFFGFVFVAIGYALMAIGSAAIFIYGAVLMFTDGFWSGLSIAIIGSVIAWGVGFVVMLAGGMLVENS